MEYNSGFASEKERLDFLMNLNEVYFGKTESIQAIENQLRKIRHKYMVSKREKPVNDPDIIEFNHMIEKQFGFGKFELLITLDPIPNAATIPIEYSFSASKKRNSYMVDISSYKFKKEYDYKCIVAMTTGLIFNNYFSTEEVMACLLYELGRNFYVCFTDNNAILSNIYIAGEIANTISNVVQQFLYTKEIVNFFATKAKDFTLQGFMSPLDNDPRFAYIKNDPEILKRFIADGEEVAKKPETLIKVAGTGYNIINAITTLFVASPLYQMLQDKMSKNCKEHVPTKRAIYDFGDYLGVAFKYIRSGLNRVAVSLKLDGAISTLQQIDVLDIITQYKMFIAKALNPITYITMPAEYKVERAANNFPTMYGYGAAEASYFGKMKCNDKVKLVHHFIKKNPGIGILIDAVTLPSKVLNGVFDPSPNGISKCYDQIKLLKHELAKENLSPEMKEIILRDISELEKQIKKLIDISNGVNDPNIAKHLYNKALADILKGSGIKDKLFDDKDKFADYDKNFNAKVQSESAIGWSCNYDQLLSEGIISDVIDHQRAYNDLKEQWKQAVDKFVTHRWIERFINPKQEEMLKKYYDNLVKEDVSYADYKKSFNFICKFMGIDNKDVMIEHLEFRQDKKDKDSRVCALCYSKGRVKIKVPEGLSLIHVSPVDGIAALNPSFRNKKLGHFMYPSKRVFFTVEKDIKAKDASISNQKTYRYRAKDNIQYVYVDPTCNTFSSRAVYVDTDKPIPVERYDKFLDRIINAITPKNEYTIYEASFENLMNDLKNWKTHNQGTMRPMFVSNNISDDDFIMLQDLIDHLHNDTDYTDYKKAFDKFCKYCHIVPRGTIIYSHELAKGKEPDHNFLSVTYAYNTKKIDIPEGTVLYHMTKVEGIKELKPFFRGKEARRFLYDKPRIYLTLNKNMFKMFADYKPTDKMIKYVVTQPIKNAYVDPLVPDILHKAIYVETNKPIPVMPLDEYAKTHNIQKEAFIDFAIEYGLKIIEEESN